MVGRRLWQIPGGIHPEEHKSRSNTTEIQQGLIPSRLVLPLQQHLGAAAEPIVTVGTHVLKGQLIAQPKGYVSCPVHAPTSGTITAIDEQPVHHPSGIEGTCITLEPDQKDEWIEHHGQPTFWELERSDLLSLIQESGIAGLGGAGFPTRVKLNPSSETPIQTLLINGVECEPYITADDRLMRERADAIVLGSYIMAYLVQPEEIIFATEDNKPEAAEALSDAIDRIKAHPLTHHDRLSTLSVSIAVVPTKYPSGGEKQIIQIITGKEVRSGAIPADVGVVCQNVGTAYAVERAVCHGEPLISRITTFTGEGLYKPGNYEVLLGTPIEEMYDQVAVREHRIKRLIMGGPMMGFTLKSARVPIVKTTNCIIAATADEFPEPPPELPCIRCGACADACPVQLLPQQLYWYSKTHNFEQAQHHNLFDCIECGACAYVCPSNIPLVQYYRFAKGEIKAIELENHKADHSRERFEARQARLEKEQQEKEAKRKERARKAAEAQKAKAAKKAAQEAEKEAEKAADKESNTAAAAGTATSDGTNRSSTTEKNLSEKSLEQLETAFNKAQKKWKDARKALTEQEKKGSDHIEAYRNKVDKLKAKMDAAKEALNQHGSAATQTAEATDITALIIAAAQARTDVTKAEKALRQFNDQKKSESDASSDPLSDPSSAPSKEALEAQLAQAQEQAATLHQQLTAAKEAAKATDETDN